jgi:ATP-dependent helicase/nuclease subunit A
VLSTTELLTQDGRRLHADLMQYRQWLLSLPPHDALQAIYGHADVLARHAAAAPAPEREHVRAQLRALLGAALQVQGGRFLTAYQWVRALRRQSLAAPRHAAPEAVQLLTVHGAKGLEADEVLLLDAAGGPPRGGGPATFIDWPGDAAAPLRFAFVASESHPPPGLQALAEQEAAAAAREELNALYVAMTRARLRLVLSGFVPHQQPASSWWQRIEPLAEALTAPEAPAAAMVDEGDFSVLELPSVGVDKAPEAINTVVSSAADEAPPSAASRIGETMHWLLEHTGDSPDGWLGHRLEQARRRFGADAGELERAEALARRILAGEAAWAWRTDEVLEAFNEVEITHDGQRLRIDRLVRRRARDGEPESWWVLDYKSAFHPERDATLHAQLARYRSAVERLHPGQLVRVAFLSGDGRLVGAATSPD